MVVSKRVRYEVLRRDGFTCRYCHAQDKPLEVDHVVPVSLGGSDKPENLVAACHDCNIGKCSVQPDETTVEDVSKKALEFRIALQEALSARVLDLDEENEFLDEVLYRWETITDLGDGYCLPMPDSWKGTARYWHGIGVPFGIIEYAFTIAKEKVDCRRIPNHAAFNYATGVVGNKVRESMDRAREAIDGS